MARFKHGSLLYNVNRESLSVAKNLSYNSEQIQSLDPTGSDQDVFLPNEDDCEGLLFAIANRSSSYNLKVYNDTTSLISTISPNDLTSFVCDGVEWIADQ